MSPKIGGPRAVAIAVAVESSHKDGSDTRVCLVTSRKHKEAYVLPKGGVESGESARAAAARELWEEEKEVQIPDTKPHKHSPTKDPHDAQFVPSTLYSVHAFQIAPSDVKETWPEAKERSRAFVPLAEAHERVAWRRGMREALEHIRL